MTIKITVTLWCHNCARPAQVRASTAYRLRSLARMLGWHRDDGVDVCPACWRRGVRGRTLDTNRPAPARVAS